MNSKIQLYSLGSIDLLYVCVSAKLHDVLTSFKDNQHKVNSIGTASTLGMGIAKIFVSRYTRYMLSVS